MPSSSEVTRLNHDPEKPTVLVLVESPVVTCDPQVTKHEGAVYESRYPVDITVGMNLKRINTPKNLVRDFTAARVHWFTEDGDECSVHYYIRKGFKG